MRLSSQAKAPVAPPPPLQPKMKNLAGIVQNPRVGTSPLVKTLNNQPATGQGVTLRVASGQQLQGYSVQLVQHQGSVKGKENIQKISHIANLLKIENTKHSTFVINRNFTKGRTCLRRRKIQ